MGAILRGCNPTVTPKITKTVNKMLSLSRNKIASTNRKKNERVMSNQQIIANKSVEQNITIVVIFLPSTQTSSKHNFNE